jgi:predicted CoA-binding protein
MTESDKKLAELLSGASTIAMVGASPNPSRPSNMVMRYLVEHGYDVIPVRPKVKEILGRTCYGSLEEIPRKVDVVDVFRKADACPAIARSATTIGARLLWLQQGIVSGEAANIARDAGLEVEMDRCIKTFHQKLIP